ncbi:hypothetical protein L208DRAFT_329367 [Tricholoma matsutake]|nr:hypothetical protein L208DRAFT_329367 [Tricholoma matsutake 945]
MHVVSHVGSCLIHLGIVICWSLTRSLGTSLWSEKWTTVSLLPIWLCVPLAADHSFQMLWFFFLDASLFSTPTHAFLNKFCRGVLVDI